MTEIMLLSINRNSRSLPELDINIVYLVAVVIVGLLGGAIGLKLASRMGSSMERDQLQDEVKFLKSSLKVSKGTVGQQLQGPTIPEDTEITEQGFDGIIRNLISKYSSMAPKRFQFLLRDPAIVNFLISEAKKNPEQAKEVLSHFMSGNANANQGPSDREQEIAITAEGA